MQAIQTDAAYQQTLDYLYTRLPMFSRIGAAAIKADLTNTIALCQALGNPQQRFPSIHIAGTNGKGSTSHMLAAILQHAGYKTGLYTSPHLIDFRERIRISGAPVGKDFVVDFVASHKALIEQINPSFFEITVAMAFAAFADEAVDIAIIETGLGGRLDSTNVITPVLSIITNISLDHTDLLGNTISAIAREKAGIIKAGIPVVIGEYDTDAQPVFEATAQRLAASLYKGWEQWQVRSTPSDGSNRQSFLAVNPDNGTTLNAFTDLAGNYQQWNIATVLTAIDVLQEAGWAVDATSAARALNEVKRTTGLRGRWDVLRQQPLIIADVAHNPAGLRLAMKGWEAIQAKEKHIIIGFVKDKDIAGALALLPQDATYHFCAADTPRAMPAEALAEAAQASGLKGKFYPSVAEAAESARTQLSPADALLITGSFFVVGEAMPYLD